MPPPGGLAAVPGVAAGETAGAPAAGSRCGHAGQAAPRRLAGHRNAGCNQRQLGEARRRGGPPGRARGAAPPGAGEAAAGRADAASAEEIVRGIVGVCVDDIERGVLLGAGVGADRAMDHLGVQGEAEDDEEDLWELSSTVSQDDWSEPGEVDEPAVQEAGAAELAGLRAAALRALDRSTRSGAFAWAMGLIREGSAPAAAAGACAPAGGRSLAAEAAAPLLEGGAGGTLRTPPEDCRPRPRPLDDAAQKPALPAPEGPRALGRGPAEQSAPEPEGPASLASLAAEARQSLSRALESGLLAEVVAAQRGREPPAAEAGAAAGPPPPATPSRRSRVVIGAARPVGRAGAAVAPPQASSAKRSPGLVRGQGLSKSSPSLGLAPLSLRHPRSPNGWSSTKVMPPPAADWMGALQARVAAAAAAHGASAMMMDLGLDVAAPAPVPPGGPLRAVPGLRALAKVASEGSLSLAGCLPGACGLEGGRLLQPRIVCSRKKVPPGALPALPGQGAGLLQQSLAAGWAAPGPRFAAWAAVS